MSIYKTLSISSMFLGSVLATKVLAHDVHGLMTERNLPKEVLNELDERAKLRNPALRKKVLELATRDSDARQEGLRRLGLGTTFESVLEGVFQADAKWDRGATITICFFDGDQVARRRVIEVAEEVFDLANLKLDVGNIENIRTCDVLRPSAIRILFNTDGHYSFIGTDALKISADSPTMGLENFHQFPILSDGQKGTIRHEFMHAIGALHEHQHPESNCNEEFNWPVIYASIPWPKSKIDFNMKPISEIDQFVSADIAASNYDQDSIMHYDLKPHMFKDPVTATCLVTENNELSEMDIRLVKKMYVE